MGRRTSDINDVQPFDIRLGDLGSMTLESGDFLGEDAVHIDVDTRREVLGCRPLVKENVSSVAGSGDRRDGQVAMILMGIILKVNENKVRLNLANHTLDALDTISIQGNGGIRILPPKEPGDSQYISGGLLLLSSYAAVASPAAIRHDQQGNIVPLSCILDERPPAAEFDIIRMSTDRENSHGDPLMRGVNVAYSITFRVRRNSSATTNITSRSWMATNKSSAEKLPEGVPPGRPFG